MALDPQLASDIYGAHALAAQGGTPLGMATAPPHPRPDLPDDSGEHGSAFGLPASFERVESNSRNEVYPHIWHDDVWDYLQR